ncbi:hypothetical protein CK203_092316 [Vitis vinifera]|uniref:Integrase catalytic domain-containing protein n=1 Tax=Vitis vinifera TaxID=29760 RepID=A0A438FJJ7_VITVI|nr:hypothetical protein CK203_092316 [Vitis vinifera]
MDSQVVTIDQFDAATTSIQEVITSLGQRMDGQQTQQIPPSPLLGQTVPQLTPFTLQSQTEVAPPRTMMVVPTSEDVHPLYGIEEVIARRLWPKSSLFDSKEKKPLGGQRPGDVGRHSFQAYGSYIPAPDLKVCFCYIGMPLNQALRKLIEAGLLTALAPRPLPQPIPPQLRMDLHFPYPTDGIHFIDLVELDDHIHMLSWDEPVVEPVVADGIYKVGGVTFGPWMPTSFRLVLDVTSVQSTIVEPLTFPCYNVQTSVVRQQPPTTARPLEGVASHEEVRREDDEILRQLQSTQTRISIRSLLASSRTHRDALIRALSQIKIETTTTPEETVRAYNNTKREVMGTLEIELLIGLTTFPTLFQSIGDMFASSEPVLQISHSEDDLFFTWFTFHEEAKLQRLIHPLQLSDGAPSTSASTLAASSSLDRMSLMTLYFPDEVDEHGTFAEIGDMIDGIVQPEFASPFDFFGVFAIEVAKEIQTAPALEFSEDDIVVDDLFEDIVSPVEGAIFEYLPVSCDITLSTPSSPTSQIFDIDDEIAQLDSDDDSSSTFDPFAGEWEIQKQLSVGFLSVVEYPEWLANVVPVSKKDEKSKSPSSFRFFERIRRFRLRLNPKKCTFGVTSRKLLGYMVSERGIEADPYKIKVILDMPTPMTEREIRDFLKDSAYFWDDQCQRAFERIREYLLSPPVLVPSTLNRPLLLYLSISGIALGCMLAQLDDSGKERAIYYLKVYQREHCCRSLTLITGFRFRVIDDDFLDKDVAAMTSLLGWLMYFDGTANHFGYKIGVLLISPHGDHIPGSNQFVDALATLTSMIDIPINTFVRPLLIESRLVPAYCCLIDEAELDDDRVSTDRVMKKVHMGVYRLYMGEHMLALWGIDIIGKILPKSSSGHEFILVTIDYFTKCVEAASYTRLTSSRVASFIKSHIICRHGVPHELISDKEYISRSEKLPFALWAYRTSFRTSIGATPLYGMEAVLPVEIEMGSLRVALEQ